MRHAIATIEAASKFTQAVEAELTVHTRHNKVSIEKLAAGFGITNKTEVKEYTELAIVKRARQLAHTEGSIRERFDKIVELYHAQVNLSHRTSQSILLQQYSTPAPISYLAGVFCELDKLEQRNGYAFEPSAGNGLLTIAGNPARIYVNEIDHLRNRNLQTQGYKAITALDASKSFAGKQGLFSAVLTNPPFGMMESNQYYETFGIKPLEHVMALRALDTMVNYGRAAIIIGGHTRWDEKGRIQAGKNRIFFNYLYSRYYVMDVININGAKLYSRQGTSFDVRLILINGRKDPASGAAPVYSSLKDAEVKTFDELFDRVMDAMAKQIEHPAHTKKTNTDFMKRMELEAEALALELELAKNLNGINGNINELVYQLYLTLREKYKTFFKILILIKNESTGKYETFDNDADRLVYMFSLPFEQYDVVKGKKVYGVSISPEKLPAIRDQLNSEGYQLFIIDKGNTSKASPTRGGLEGAGDDDSLGAPYEPASQACVVLDTQVPDSMSFETQTAIERVRQEVGGDVDNFVRHRLNYPTKTALCRVLSAEQIDAVAMAIYNIEARQQGIIIGDQTGIGKGRVAASMIRYGVNQGLKPVFLTEKANLFSDIYRDLAAIGSAHLKPFIVNSRDTKTDIKDEDGEIIYQAPPLNKQQEILISRNIPGEYDFVIATYTQFNAAEKKPEKPNFLKAIASDNIFILDEAHNSSGSSNTGEFMQEVLRNTRGVVFLSATFAKRPDNMPIYAMKTAIADCNMSKEDLVFSINKGGVALQEILSSQLVAEGQMIRRERSFEGIEVNYISLDEKAEEHQAVSDNITKVLRDIIAFQSIYVNKMVEDLDELAVAEGKEVVVRDGTSQAGVDNLPYFSKVFQVINQMLFSLKAEAVAEQAIARLQEGKKPVIAFASTMGSFIENMENENGLPVNDGDIINTDFSEVLLKGLNGVMRYTVRDIDGNPVYKHFELSELSTGAQQEYNRILEKIKNISTGISISPIDIIIKRITDAGYRVAEVTGRKYEVQLMGPTMQGKILTRKRINTNDAFRQFNNNEVDVLMINQSGSTGASAHAITTVKVPKDQVRQRVMIVLQAELDISTEVQKRGRINRTGQLLKPIYDYVTSAIPAEKRLMMILQKKLKSLDANTTSNQKQSTKILDVPDFLNKYGDKIVKDYLTENTDVNDLLDDPLHLNDNNENSNGSFNTMEEASLKVSGRVAVLSTKMQQGFYNEIGERYNDYIEYLKQIGEYDLEVEAMNLEAETISSKVIKMGRGTDSAFGDDSILETVKANVLKKPFNRAELENLIVESLKGKSPRELQEDIIKDFKIGIEQRLAKELADAHAKYDLLKMSIAAEKKIQKILEHEGEDAWYEAIEQRQQEIEQARETQLTSIERNFDKRRDYMLKAFNFFYPGRFLNYPVEGVGTEKDILPAVFLGFVIDKTKGNPYAPSAIRMRFAIASSTKYLAIPASYNEEILAVIGSSIDITQPEPYELLNLWENYTKQNSVNRKTRYIITGNLLQAFSDFRGKLVSYTTINQQTKKGILMPENWTTSEQQQDKMVIPILKALQLIKSITSNGHIVTNNGISFFRQGDNYKIIVAASRVKGGSIYLDKEILALVKDNNFEKTSDKMVAWLPTQNIEKLVHVLQDNHSCSITIHSSQARDLKLDTVIRQSNRNPIQLPDMEKPQDETGKLKLIELEAEALLLELELLAA